MSRIEPPANPSSLWDDHELDVCPRCGEQRLTPRAPGMAGYRTCLDCGVIEIDGEGPDLPRLDAP
jgi:hypothetical protein